MKRLDTGKVSFVDFMQSIKFAHNTKRMHSAGDLPHLAHFNPRARGGYQFSAEDSQLIRSAN